MGTNFYVRVRNENGGFERVHIGKKSCGWKFLFKDNPQYYSPTKRDINRFLVLHKNYFYDEYGELQNPEDFWKDTVDESNDGFDFLSYLNYRVEQGEVVSSWEWYYVKNDFYSDGLWFTTNDFS